MPTTASLPWRLPTLVTFRFFVIYFTLYVLTTQMLGGLLVLPFVNTPSLQFLVWGLVAFVGRHLFHVAIVQIQSGSGDKLVDWLQAFSLLGLAAIGAAAWSALDRKRSRYDRTYRYFRVFLRFALGTTMIGYGFAKAVPLQMPAPSLTRLLEQYGSFSPMGVLWYSIGASFPYERFVGCMELAGGILLFIPRTARLGALVCIADAVEILVLNLTYDVPVKLFAFHLLAMAVFLAAPDIGALARMVLADGARTRWAAVTQIVLGLYFVGNEWRGAETQWKMFGGGVPRPPLYGVWDVDEMTIDGQDRPPLLTDAARWRRIVVDLRGASPVLAFWPMDDVPVSYPASINPEGTAISFSRSGGAPRETLTVDRGSADHATFAGTIGGHAIRMATHLKTRDQFLLVNRGFHWIQELPFNR